MRLETGQLVRLNRNMGRYKEGETFKVIEISDVFAVLKSIVTNYEYIVYREFNGVDLIEREFSMFNIGDIIELTKYVMIYEKGLICQVVEIDEDDTDYGYVKILKYPDGREAGGQKKHANLTLFKLVRRNGFYV